MTPEQTTIMAGMKRAGMTNAQIAARLGLTLNAVRYQCARAKVSKSLTHKAGRFSRWGAATQEQIDDLNLA